MAHAVHRLPAVRAIGFLRSRVRATVPHVRRVTNLLADGLAALGDHLSYRRQELVTLGLLAASILGGFAVQTWRARSPALLGRLEAEPPLAGDPARVKASREGARHLSIPRSLLAPTPETPLDLNQATEADLMRLPGIGPRLAARIIAQRRALGGRFESWDDLGRVQGIGRARLAALRPLVTVAVAGRNRVLRSNPTHEPP